MDTSNPCGLSYIETLNIIKDHVLTGSYNGRDEVMKALQKKGYLYSEAKAVTDQYYKIYNRLSTDAKIKKPTIILSPKEKLAKRMNNIAVDYLNGKTGGFPMTGADIDNLEELYRKVERAETPTLKEKYNEEAAVFVQKFLPGYTNELFKSSVYARPLLSAVFFIKSLTSNLHAQVERSISDIFDVTGNKINLDFTKLGKLNGLANKAFFNVLKGGVPATSLYQSESNVGTAKGRLEEFSISDTSATSNPVKAGYYGLMKFFTKWSNRFNAAPDTRGIFSNAERHFYQLSKEKFRQAGQTDEQATQSALQAIELDDRDTAIRMAEAKFKELGEPIYKKDGKTYTTEFQVAASEYQRIHRSEEIWGKALQLSKNDFWKRNMTIASEMGFGDYGIFGFKAQALSGLRDKLEKHSKNKLTSAFNLYAFGFLNGAANFAEDALERVPLYGATKVAILQAKKAKVTDVQLHNDIARRQRDIIVKNITTAAFFVAARMAERLLCPDKASKATSENISSGRTQIGPCGIPVLVPPQMLAVYKMYDILENAFENDEEFFETALNILPVLTQSNEVGLGGAVDKFSQGVVKWGSAEAKGNQVQAAEEKSKLLKNVVRSAVDYANSFIPLPSRVMNETGTVIQRARGLSQHQQDLPFAVDEAGNPKGMMNTLGKVTIASLGNVTGINEMIIAMTGSDKNYATDWQGRRIVQLRGSDITGNGIQYNEADDILASAGVRAPYVNRLQKVKVSKSKEKTNVAGHDLTLVSSKVRYLTDDEYFNVSEALGDWNKSYMTKNENRLIKDVKASKAAASKELESIFKSARNSAVKAVEAGKKSSKEILKFVTDMMKERNPSTFTETDTQ